MSGPTGKKVIIVGAGAQGIVITGVLAAADDVAEIVLGDIDVARAREIAETNGSPKIRVIELDATDLEGMTRVMKEGSFDLVVNATLPRFVHNVMKASYAARINYIDMASNEIYPTPEVPIEQFFYADEWKKAGLQCLTGGGGDPGLTNIMAKLGVNQMDTVDSIKIKDFGMVECDEPVALWSMETFLEDVYLQSTIWEDGKPKVVEASTGREEYFVPGKINRDGVFYFHDHEEAVTIPLFCGKPVKYADFKIGAPDIDMWVFLVKGLHLMDPEKLEFEGGSVSPREMLFKLIPPTLSPKKQIELYESDRLSSDLCVTCDVIGEKDGKPISISYWSESPSGKEACSRIRGTNDVSWLTSVPCSIFSLMLLRGQIKATGVFPPEVLDPDEIEIFLEGIKANGIDVIEKVNRA
ncbi:MAG: saccharopine dehydrogenase NADP-binding domain-containing protein [Deltaproteobacteria bacterium]|jgi:saccharopine dehydrogenase-like NADP-dependent oxidoreductase|nr:saccharopine dehydrogenase NADP-binding domain-containing protein [Deltaproteobacteria bacterium]